MTHQEYIAAIEKQRSLINRLFKCRKERSEVIDRITKDRYTELIGKFFKADDRLKYADIGEYYYVVDVYTCSNYIDSNEVEVMLACRRLGTTMQSWDSGMKVVGVEIYPQTFRFEPSDDIISLIEPMMVPNEEAMSHFEDLKRQLTENFLFLKEET